jgi:hypothetical protein
MSTEFLKKIKEIPRNFPPPVFPAPEGDAGAL